MNRRLFFLLVLFLSVAGLGTAYLSYQGRPSADESAATQNWVDPVLYLVSLYQRQAPARLANWTLTTLPRGWLPNGRYALGGTYKPDGVTPCGASCRPGEVATGNQAGDLWFGKQLRYTKPNACSVGGDCIDASANDYEYAWVPPAGSSVAPEPAFTRSNQGVNPGTLTATLSPTKKQYDPGETVTVQLDIQLQEHWNPFSEHPQSLPLAVYLSKNDGRDAVRETCAPGNLDTNPDWRLIYGTAVQINPNVGQCLDEDHSFARYPDAVSYTQAGQLNWDHCIDFAGSSAGSLTLIDQDRSACQAGPNGVTVDTAGVPLYESKIFSWGKSQHFTAEITLQMPKETGSAYRLELLGRFRHYSWQDYQEAYYGAWYSPKFGVGQQPPELTGTLTKADGSSQTWSADQPRSLEEGERLDLTESFTNSGESNLNVTLELAIPADLMANTTDASIVRTSDDTLRRTVIVTPGASASLNATLTLRCDDQACPSDGTEVTLTPVATSQTYQIATLVPGNGTIRYTGAGARLTLALNDLPSGTLKIKHQPSQINQLPADVDEES